MSATPFADQRTTAGDTFTGRYRIIYNFGFCKPLCIPVHTEGTVVHVYDYEGTRCA
jgi:hypothetical protein